MKMQRARVHLQSMHLVTFESTFKEFIKKFIWYGITEVYSSILDIYIRIYYVQDLSHNKTKKREV